ncbi:glutathione S-transferase family protein [Rhodovibrionaceae bacterium A322]
MPTLDRSRETSPLEMDQQSLTLVSYDLCPYVQRAAISLLEKNVPFNRVSVDLADKPQWFRDISPLGKVPLLLVQQQEKQEAIFESAVILAYLEETQPQPLLAPDPIARARQRGWIEVGSTILNGIGAFYSAGSEEALLTKASDLKQMFRRVDAQLAQRQVTGPWFQGSDFCLVDAVYGPVFRYFDCFDRIADFGILKGLNHLSDWRKALSERPSVRQAVSPDFSEKLWAFLRKRGSALSRMMPAE